MLRLRTPGQVPLVLMLAAAVAVFASSPDRAARGAGDRTQLRVAVLDFQGTGTAKDVEALGAGLQSMLTTDLAQLSSLTVIERARLRDVQKELKLSRSAAADPATAVKIGKLAGASHLVIGTHTVLEKKMRIDARMIEVASAKVVLAESAEGELDGFFELEKKLVGKLIEAVGVKMTVKERGAVAKIHTTDLDAFRQFGAGVQLFDQQKYDEALVALRGALKKDDDFKLARTTLAEYERIAAELRARATDIEMGEQEKERVVRQGRQAERKKVLDKLFEIASASGEGARLRRAAALYMLACTFKGFGSGSDMFGYEDRFANHRTADALAQRYYSDGLALFPRVPLVVHCMSNIGPEIPESIADFDKVFGEIAGRLEEGKRSSLEHHARWTAEMARDLHLDSRAEADLFDRVYEQVQRLEPDAEWRRDMLERRAAMRRALLEMSESTRLLKQAADVSDTERHSADSRAQWLRRYAEEIEENGKLARELEAAGRDAQAREFAMIRMGPGDGVGRGRRQSISAKDLLGFRKQSPDEIARDLSYRRGFTSYVLIGRSPVWEVRGSLATGPRSDSLRAEEIRYAGVAPPRGQEAVAIVDGVPRKDVRAAFDVDFAVPPDFRATGFGGRGDEIAPGRPEVTFLFGARCVECDRTPDPATGGWRFGDQPLEAWGVTLAGEKLSLARLSLAKERRSGAQDRLTADVKATQSVSAGGTRVAVSVRVEGTSATVSLAGKSYSFTLPGDRGGGFYGFMLRGPGFVAIRKLDSGPAGKGGR